MDLVLIGWIVVFIIALWALVKGADWLLLGAERIGLWWGLSPFIVGVVIVGLGTSFPELISSVFAILAGETNIVAANAVGSNIANILLVVGLSALIGGRLVVTKSLIDLDLPLLAITTVLFIGVAFDGTITQIESGLLFVSFMVYFGYTLTHRPDSHDALNGAVEDHRDAHVNGAPLPGDSDKKEDEAVTLTWHDFFFLAIGIVSLALGAKYLIDSVIAVSAQIGIGTGAIALAAIALGTSLPELLVSIKAARDKKSEVALGNIFGSNVFNLLFVVGVPGLFTTLALDNDTLLLGLPILVAATILFVISGISRRVHVWEGAMYLILYGFFVGKLFGLL